jgi:nucleoside-diphosphate-sugar epimerase
MARVLIVGCGCRGSGLARRLAAAGYAVRGTTRDLARTGPIEAAGAEAVVADPDRLATLVPQLAEVSTICWLLGSAQQAPELHGARLRTLLERVVDTPVRGVVYEAAGSVGEAALARGLEVARDAHERWMIPLQVLEVAPGDHDAWLQAAHSAVTGLLV